MITGLIKGDTHKLEITLNTNITDWKIRCEIFDSKGNSVKLANTASGGSDNEIELVDVTNGVIYVKVATGDTTDFADKANIELEVVTNNDETLTVLQNEILFKKEKITWTSPS